MRVEADTTFWNTGFRAALSHLAPLRLTCACSWLRVTDPRYDRMVLIEDLLGVAESERTAALGGLDARTRSELGQFFTPMAAARLIASIPRLPEAGILRVLDPGAGSGVLAAALVGRVVAERPGLSLEIVAVERDPALLPSLHATLRACEQAGGGRVQSTKIGRASCRERV